jgi:hypothetical protein
MKICGETGEVRLATAIEASYVVKLIPKITTQAAAKQAHAVG